MRQIAAFLGLSFFWLISAYGTEPLTEPIHDAIVSVQLDENGLLYGDDEFCTFVGEDDIARFLLNLPEASTEHSQSYESTDTNDPSGYKAGTHDYAAHSIYISTPIHISGTGLIEQLFPDQLLTFHNQPETVELNIPAPGNAGRELCIFTPIGMQRIKSMFEIYGRWGLETLFIRGMEAVTGDRFKQLGGAYFWQSLPHFMMLQNQITAGEDIKKEIQLKLEQPKSRAALMALITYALVFQSLPQETVMNLSTLGSFRLFWIASMCNHFLDTLDYGVVAPISNYYFLGNGSQRSPESQTISEFFRGYFVLLAMYAGQSFWIPPGNTKADLEIPDEMVSMTIVTTMNSRQFIVNLNDRYLWKGIPILQLMQDSIVSISLASVSDPSHIAYFTFDTYLKEIAGAVLSTADELNREDVVFHEHSDSYLQWAWYSFYASVALSGIRYYFPSISNSILQQLPVPGVLTSYASPALSGISSSVGWIDTKVLSMTQTAGNKIYVPIAYMTKKIPFSLPSLAETGFPSIYTSKVSVIHQAGALYMTFRFIGPAFISLVQSVSEYSYDPGSMFGFLFKSDREVNIEHYLKDSPE